MVGTLRKSGLLILIGSVLFVALAIACTREVEVPGETVVVEKEVIKEVEVPGETVVVEKEVVRTVEVEKEVEVIKEVEVDQRGRGDGAARGLRPPRTGAVPQA